MPPLAPTMLERRPNRNQGFCWALESIVSFCLHTIPTHLCNSRATSIFKWLLTPLVTLVCVASLMYAIFCIYLYAAYHKNLWTCLAHLYNDKDRYVNSTAPPHCQPQHLPFDPKPRAKILFLIAHPDDEVLFFAPTISYLTKLGAAQAISTMASSNLDIHVMCLSYGGYNPAGATRRSELYASCEALGIPPANVIVLDLKDDPAQPYNPAVLAGVISHNVRRCFYPQPGANISSRYHHGEDYDIEPQTPVTNHGASGLDYIFTFDFYGVSGHVNHVAIPLALSHLANLWSGFGSRSEQIIQVYLLQSVSVWRKYASILDLPFSYVNHGLGSVGSYASAFFRSLLTYNHPYRMKTDGNYDMHTSSSPNSFIVISDPRDYSKARAAFGLHKSQHVWYRWLYIFFSRYMLFNTWIKMDFNNTNPLIPMQGATLKSYHSSINMTKEVAEL